MGGPRRSAILLYAVAAGALLLDQLSKAWVEHALAGEPAIEVIPGVLSLTYTTNSGGAFGFGESAPWLFAGATIVVSAVIVVVSTRPMRPAIAVSLGLILGGALGNLADRVANGPGFSGRVTDFIDLQVWPIFNLADTAIVVGAVILAFASLDGADDRTEPSGASGPAATGSGGAEP
ncbi:MAG TPA: signal peptidase II [Actinomycetota bacterium]|nr:signal peptidase II [Actinomycetota bacterium]